MTGTRETGTRETGTRKWCRYRLMKGVIAIVVIGIALILVPTNHKNRYR
ncbi:hypothetical protein [Bacillus sp. N1-1]|nr:hypothetical protein [Bacillus sp. N1-1]QHA91251.1 hypothetical protein GNK04_07370 [Bacillus sp. N1-1]